MGEFIVFWLKILYVSGVCAVVFNKDWRSRTVLDCTVVLILAALWPVSVPWALLRKARQSKEWPYDN